jgi:hypothetical protein
MFLCTWDGNVAVDSIVLIEALTETPHGTPFHPVHYQHGSDTRVTKAHSDYVTRILPTVATVGEWRRTIPSAVCTSK